MEDDHAPLDKLQEWQQFTTSTFTLKIFPGHHFYLKDKGQDVLHYIQGVVLGDGKEE